MFTVYLILKFGDSCIHPFSQSGPNSAWEWTHGCAVLCQISPWSVHISLPKTAKKTLKTAMFTKFWSLGSSVPTPSRSGPNLARETGHIVYYTVPNFTVIGKYCGAMGLKRPKTANLTSFALQGVYVLQLCKIFSFWDPHPTHAPMVVKFDVLDSSEPNFTARCNMLPLWGKKLRITPESLTYQQFCISYMLPINTVFVLQHLKVLGYRVAGSFRSRLTEQMGFEM